MNFLANKAINPLSKLSNISFCTLVLACGVSACSHDNKNKSSIDNIHSDNDSTATWHTLTPTDIQISGVATSSVNSEIERFGLDKTINNNANNHNAEEVKPSSAGETLRNKATEITMPDRVAPIEVPSSSTMTAAEFAESLDLSRATVAAGRKDMCPKLLKSRVGNRSIIRTNESLKQNFCDYYLYPTVGDSLMMESRLDILKATLVAPTNHDFANGEYVVKKEGKHVIRLTYTGSEYLNDPVIYNVEVTIEPSQPERLSEVADEIQ